MIGVKRKMKIGFQIVKKVITEKYQKNNNMIIMLK